MKKELITNYFIKKTTQKNNVSVFSQEKFNINTRQDDSHHQVSFYSIKWIDESNHKKNL